MNLAQKYKQISKYFWQIFIHYEHSFLPEKHKKFKENVAIKTELQMKELIVSESKHWNKTKATKKQKG